MDYGTKLVGLACCDELGVAVRPLPPLRNRSHRELMLQIRASVQTNDIEAIVVGIPLNMDGTSGKAAGRVERFMRRLQTELNLPLEGVDERLSSVEALERWKEMSPRQQKKYSSMDSLAAALILERYLRES